MSIVNRVLIITILAATTAALLPAQQPGKYVCVLDPGISTEEPRACPVCGFDTIPRELAETGLYSFTCPEHRELQFPAPGKCPRCARRLVVEDLREKADVTYVCPMHPAVTSPFMGKCSRCGMDLVDESKLERKSAAYRCPMDPQEVSGEPAQCSKCGMKLVPVEPDELAHFPLELTTLPVAFRSGQDVKLRFSVTNPVTQRRVKEFDVVHDKLFHLFIISQDLEYFDHIHPELEEDGAFTIETSLPRPGYYRVYSDFLPTGGTPQLIQENLVTADCRTDLHSSMARLVPDTDPAKTVDSMKVTLETDPSEFIAGRETALRYSLLDAKTGDPVTDLHPYLQAWGHTFVLNEDGSESIHSHPTDEVPTDADPQKLRSKPNIEFQAFFPKPGRYRIWTQFLRNDTISTFVFTVEAHRLR